MGRLSIITFNVLGIPFVTTHQKKNYLSISRNLRSRFTTIAHELNNSNTDILLLQELHLYPLLRSLKKNLTNYPHLYYKKFLYGPKGGLVLFSKYELEEVSFLDFKSRGSLKNKSFVTRIMRNGILSAKLKDHSLTLLNTYITGDFTHNWETENKYRQIQRSQLEETANFLKSLQSDSVLVAGDININTNTPLYHEFISSTKLTDPFYDYKTPTMHHEFLPKDIIAPRLDHIFISSKLRHKTKTSELFAEKVILNNKKAVFLSDHLALRLEIEF